MVLEHWIATCKRLEVDPYFTPCAKLKSGSTSYMQSQNYKLLEKNTRVDIHGLEFGMNSEIPKAWALTKKDKIRLHQRRRQWHPTPVLLPGKSHGRRSLVGCSPWGHEESDTTERLHFHSSLSCIGEGNANPLQCSCLENPRGGGAWWAAVYGVAQSRTWLKWLRSSSIL